MKIKDFCQKKDLPFEECRIFFKLPPDFRKYVEVKNLKEIENEDHGTFEPLIVHAKMTKYNSIPDDFYPKYALLEENEYDKDVNTYTLLGVWNYNGLLTSDERKKMAKFLKSLNDEQIYNFEENYKFVSFEILSLWKDRITLKREELLNKLSDLERGLYIPPAYEENIPPYEEGNFFIEELDREIPNTADEIRKLDLLFLSVETIENVQNKKLEVNKEINSLLIKTLFDFNYNDDTELITKEEYKRLLKRSGWNIKKPRRITSVEICQMIPHYKDNPEKLNILEGYPHYDEISSEEISKEKADEIVLRSHIFTSEEDLPEDFYRNTSQRKIPKENFSFEKLLSMGLIPYATEEQILFQILSSRKCLYNEDLAEDDDKIRDDDMKTYFINERNLLKKYLDLYDQTIKEFNLE